MKQHTLPLEQLQAWSHLNNCKLNGIKVEPHIITNDGIDKGGGLIATADHVGGSVLLSVDSSVILCKEQVWQRAKTDRHLSQILDALGDFVQTPRKLFLVFLLMQMTTKSPDLSYLNIGLSTPLTDYYSFLPKKIPLPTFYTAEEREMLVGTSLSDALDQKLSSLELEFKALRERTEPLEWAHKAWWHEEVGRLTFEDWLLVDAIYRSRALELPRDVGDAMVPVLDMANHASDGQCNARFELDSSGNVLLLVRDGKSVKEGEEITIMYGCGGACEMMFSYGFIEQGAVSARELFLGLEIPHDDPLRLPKYHYAKEAPGVRIFTDNTGRIRWDSDFIWWACINEEDGLDFDLLQTVDGDRQLQALWRGSTIHASDLKATLFADPRKDLFELRAVVMIQERVEKQGEELSSGLTDLAAQIHKRYESYQTIARLRELELELLTASYTTLDDQKKQLLDSRTVSEYLSGAVATPMPEGQEEDFA